VIMSSGKGSFISTFLSKGLTLEVGQPLLLSNLISPGLARGNGKQSSQAILFPSMLSFLMIPFLRQPATLQYSRHVHLQFCLSSLAVYLILVGQKRMGDISLHFLSHGYHVLYHFLLQNALHASQNTLHMEAIKIVFERPELQVGHHQDLLQFHRQQF